MSKMKTPSRPVLGVSGVIVLAAGLGKRMKSSLPKVLHELGGQPLVVHVLKRVFEVSPNSPVSVVVGHDREKVEAADFVIDNSGSLDRTDQQVARIFSTLQEAAAKS